MTREEFNVYMDKRFDKVIENLCPTIKKEETENK